MADQISTSFSDLLCLVGNVLPGRCARIAPPGSVVVFDDPHLALLERVKGIEPSYAAWEAAVLPLNYTRSVRPL